MRFNDLAIENAVLETETIKSLRNLQERNRLDEFIVFAPWVIAAAQWAIAAAAAYGISWLTEEAVGKIISNWQESGFRPNPNMIPEGTRVVIEDSQSGNRINFRYQGGWQRQDVGGSNTWAPVRSEDMTDVLEKAGRQRRGWLSRIFGGRRRFNGLGYDFSRVDQADFNRSIMFADLAQNRNLANSNHFREVQSEYDRVRSEHPELYQSARARTLRKSTSGSWMSTLANLGFGLGFLWYQVNELEDVYRQRFESGELQYSDYQSLHNDLVDATKNILTQVIAVASIATLVGIGANFIVQKIPLVRRLKGLPRLAAASIISGASVTAALNSDYKAWLVEFLSDSYLLDNVGIDRLFQGRLDELIRLLGLEDIVTTLGREFDQEQLDDIGDLGDTPLPKDFDVGNFLFQNN